MISLSDNTKYLAVKGIISRTNFRLYIGNIVSFHIAHPSLLVMFFEQRLFKAGLKKNAVELCFMQRLKLPKSMMVRNIFISSYRLSVIEKCLINHAN